MPSHYKVATSVRNSGPVISAIKLGSDIDGNGTVIEAEKTSFTVSGSTTDATSFTMKQYPMTFDIAASAGNGDLHYYLKETNSGFNKEGSLRTSGTLATIQLVQADLAAIGDRTASLTITVWDSTDETVFSTYSTPHEPGRRHYHHYRHPSGRLGAASLRHQPLLLEQRLRQLDL